MNYQTARPAFRSGDLIALTHYKWASWYDLQVQAVRFFTQSEYSHVGIIWVFGGRVWVIESVTPVIRIVPLSLMANDGFFHIAMEAEMGDAELTFLLSKIGRGQYSKLQAIAAQLRRLNIGADDLWECAELVVAARRLSGVDLGDKATPSAVVMAAMLQGAPCRFVSNHQPIEVQQ